ncbi:hypothetical protein SAMN04488540_10510 [Ferrimonas sediminum]|uniref:Uncharacterized protein n=1 Tax=Ferrimonas sediminum TaxID=718193 RepID=A0A1G8QZS9_9GAMM|nr:hypothetical protein [Ferrimonas sediminum]SDJ10191.1 hypothetical protein SAMN04488540_10510 [Ferrimonas sediminum]
MKASNRGAAFGASIFSASAMNSCAWECMMEHNACVESGTSERYCKNQYRSCRSQC